METLIRALERGCIELHSRGSFTSEVTSSSMSSCNLGSLEAKASARVEVSDSMADKSKTPGIRTPLAEALSRSYNNQISIPLMNNFIGKRRSGRRNKAPLTIMRADPIDFQAMVHQMWIVLEESFLIYIC